MDPYTHTHTRTHTHTHHRLDVAELRKLLKDNAGEAVLQSDVLKYSLNKGVRVCVYVCVCVFIVCVCVCVCLCVCV